MTVHKFQPASLAKLGMAFTFALVAMAPAAASPVVYDFESLGDLEVVTNQFAGLSFSNTLTLKKGIDLNDGEFPPLSGDTVVTDDGGAITITLAAPAFSVGAYFTYLTGLTFSAYDAGNNLLGSLNSLFTSNLAVSGVAGSSPNEFIAFADAGGLISRITITGDPAGGSFVMDNLTVDSGNAVPEPGTLALALGLLSLGCVPGGWLRRRSG